MVIVAHGPRFCRDLRDVLPNYARVPNTAHARKVLHKTKSHLRLPTVQTVKDFGVDAQWMAKRWTEQTMLDKEVLWCVLVEQPSDFTGCHVLSAGNPDKDFLLGVHRKCK
eukprot:2371931-Amphidinium_carterae.2